MKSRWTIWKGHNIFFCDFAGFKSDLPALKAEVDAADREIMKAPKGSVLVMVDINNTVASAAVVDMFKESAKLTEPYIHRQAVIGLSGFKRFLADVVARFSGQSMRLFDSEGEAMDWLAGAIVEGGIPVGGAA
jgi:hypothetical protein